MPLPRNAERCGAELPQAGLYPQLGWESGPPFPQLLSLAWHHACHADRGKAGGRVSAAATEAQLLLAPLTAEPEEGEGGPCGGSWGGASPREQRERSGCLPVLHVANRRRASPPRCPLMFPLGPPSAMCRAGGGVGQISVDSV